MFYGIPVEEAAELECSACILHMAGRKKPWNDIESGQLAEWTSYMKNFGEFVNWERNFILRFDKEYQNCRQEVELLREENRSLEEMFSQQIIQKTDVLRERLTDLEMEEQNYFQNVSINIEQIKEQTCQLKEICNDLNSRTESMEKWVILRIYKAIKNILCRKKL